MGNYLYVPAFPPFRRNGVPCSVPCRSVPERNGTGVISESLERNGTGGPENVMERNGTAVPVPFRWNTGGTQVERQIWEVYEITAF